MDQELMNQLTHLEIYTIANLPASIGNAIYSYGSNEIREITAYIEGNPTGEKGMIITPDCIYYSDTTTGKIQLDHIESLRITQDHQELYINDTLFTCSFIDLYIFGQLLSDMSDIGLLLKGTLAQRIEYDLKLLIQDVLEDAYEDVVLTYNEREALKGYLEEIQSISSLEEVDYNFELEQICPKAYAILDNLGLDSDEMDDLEEIMKKLEEKQAQQNATFENAAHYYEDMMNKYRNGDPGMLNQFRNILKLVGIDEADLQNKSPEELNQLLENLCRRYGISKEQVENFARNYRK